MAFVNLPPNFQDIFAKIDDRLSKLETGPNQAMYTAVTAQSTASSAQGSAAAASAQATTAMIDAAAASAAAATAYSKASTAIQVSGNTIVNASNQLTSINGNGILVYSGSSQSTGARVLLNSEGIIAFNAQSTNNSTGRTLTISSADGSISMLGSLTAGSKISGATITGGVIQTSTGNTSVSLVGTENGIGFKDSGAYSGWISSIGTAGIVSNYGATPSSTAYPQSRITSGAATLAGTASAAFSANSNGTTGITGNLTVSNTATFSSTVTLNQATSYPGISTGSGSTMVIVSTGSRIAYTTSSERFKEQIQYLASAGWLDKVEALRPITYVTATDFTVEGEPNPTQLGLLAEDLADLDNEISLAVNDDPLGDPFSISYERLVVPLIMAVKELKARVEELESKI